MNWFYKLVAFIMALFIPATVSDVAEYTTVKENPEMVFTILSDTHIEGNNEERFTLFSEGLIDVNSAKRNDALIFLGDNTMNNQVIELSAFYNILNDYNKIGTVLIVAGNHDVSPNDYNFGNFEDLRERYLKFRKEHIKAQYDDNLYYSYTINDYKFIVLSTESYSDVWQDISDTQFTWLENELEDAKKNNNPVFILSHYPLNHTWEDVWQEGHIGEDSDRLYEILKNAQNQIFYFSGHLHMGLYEDHREVVFEDNITFVSVPSFGSINEVGDAPVQDRGVGHQVEIYEDEVIIRVRNFAKHKWMDVEYKVSISN